MGGRSCLLSRDWGVPTSAWKQGSRPERQGAAALTVWSSLDGREWFGGSSVLPTEKRQESVYGRALCTDRRWDHPGQSHEGGDSSRYQSMSRFQSIPRKLRLLHRIALRGVVEALRPFSSPACFPIRSLSESPIEVSGSHSAPFSCLSPRQPGNNLNEEKGDRKCVLWL